MRCAAGVIPRQDSDKILVREVAGCDSGSPAVEASLTGHTVFATIHTNEAPTTITRLVKSVTLHSGKGCAKCHHTGYRGRMGLSEVMPIGGDLRRMIETGASINELRQAAISGGMETLRECGLRGTEPRQPSHISPRSRPAGLAAGLEVARERAGDPISVRSLSRLRTAERARMGGRTTPTRSCWWSADAWVLAVPELRTGVPETSGGGRPRVEADPRDPYPTKPSPCCSES